MWRQSPWAAESGQYQLPISWTKHHGTTRKGKHAPASPSQEGTKRVVTRDKLQGLTFLQRLLLACRRMLQRKFVLQRKFALQFEDESRAYQENKYTDTSTTISEIDQLLYIYILQNYLIHFWTGLCMQHKLRELLSWWSVHLSLYRTTLRLLVAL